MTLLGVRLSDCLLVLKLSCLVKLTMLLGQVLCNVLIPDHHSSMEDVEMKFYRFPEHHWLTEILFGGFDNWDSEYYIHISNKGYTSLQTMAFFPLYPGLMYIIGRVPLAPFSFLISYRSIFLLSGILINICVFPLAALALYLLSLSVTHNRRFSLMTVILFCVNPASVFMSAVYTETLFSFFTFSGLCFLSHRYHWTASLLFSFSSATRANGIVLAGFIGYYHLSSVLQYIRHKLRPKLLVLNYSSAIITICGMECLLVVLPFILFQSYSFWKFCHNSASVEEEMFEWCHWSLPLSYPYIQQHYWNVGFLRYFQLKQIPNFLLAFPAVFLSLLTLYSYICGNFTVLKESGVSAFGYMMHLLFLVAFGIFNMHIQVLTRFLFSSTPLLYWFSASVLCEALPSYPSPTSLSPLSLVTEPAKLLLSDKSKQSKTNRTAKLIGLYYTSYVVIGFILHCNFYPWT